MGNLNISFDPNKKSLLKIKEWLMLERDLFNEGDFNGFYCNWEVILNLYEKHQMVVALLENLPVGFLVWHNSSDYTVTIEIMEIHYNHRRQGYGEILFAKASEYFRHKGKVVVDLQCSPSSSKSYWKKLGFNEFEINHCSDKDLYRFNVPSCPLPKSEIKKYEDEIIELWDLEPYESINLSPRWSWSICYHAETDVLIEPIIFPCKYEWRIRWRKGDTIFADKKYAPHQPHVFPE